MSKSLGRSKASKKTRKNNQDLESSNLFDDDLDPLEEIDDLDDSDLDESDLDGSDLDEDLERKRKRDPSMSKEINKMINNIKAGDLAVPAIGLGLVAIIGIAIYRGIKI
jgi:hypothetical protein